MISSYILGGTWEKYLMVTSWEIIV